MRPIPAEPPPFFHRGPSPLARLAFFGLASIVLLFVDARYRTLEDEIGKASWRDRVWIRV